MDHPPPPQLKIYITINLFYESWEKNIKKRKKEFPNQIQ